MQVVESLVQLDRPSVVTIGVFDGVHLGHQKLIQQVVEQAHQQQAMAVVISFFPHPDVVLRGITGRYYLTPRAEKAHLLAQLDVDILILHPFNADVRQTRAADFVDRLLATLNMQTLMITPEFALGYQREGNLAFLTEQGQQKGFEVVPFELVGNNGDRISSTAIRNAIEAGEVESVTTWLNRPYRLSGEVVHGAKRGRTIGFPTANIAVWDQQVMPANGVYACRAYLGEETFNAVTNIGQRPTFDGQNVTVEAHILDFDRDIYGQTLSIDLIHRLRGEQKFSGIDALVEQIGKDRDRAREVLTD